MHVRRSASFLVAAITLAAPISPLAVDTLAYDLQDARRGRGVFSRQLPRGYQEPAFARGYADGYEEGLRDGRERDRYDPVGSRDYRKGDTGYAGSYGSRDAYKNNYRAGFRQGYDDGYRGRTR